jgi:hypothetical protein
MQFKQGDILKLKHDEEFELENELGELVLKGFPKNTLFKFINYMDEYDPDYPEDFNDEYIEIAPLVGRPGDVIYDAYNRHFEKM